MRAKYSIVLAGLLLTTAVAAAPCPPAVSEVAAKVAKLRAVAGPFTPPCRFISPADLRAELDRKLRRDLPIPPHRFLEALIRTGFITGDPAQIYKSLLDFYSGQVLGFYEPQADQLVVVNTPAADDVGSSLVWAHELEHAVQEHRFHLPSRLLAMRDDSDEQRAASAVAEGEAMLVMFLISNPSADPNALDRTEKTVCEQARTLRRPPGVPEYFVADLVFPYTTGFAAVLRAYRGGGWDAVNHLLARPPTTTAELLHPDRSGTPDGVPARALPAAPPGWEEVLTDSVGEWGLAFLLGRGADPERAAAVASGWDGDRMRLIRNRAEPNRWALVWRLRGRTPRARGEIEDALRRDLTTLFAALAPPGPPALSWSASERILEVRAAWPDGPMKSRSPS
jgi:hypothetical protein